MKGPKILAIALMVVGTLGLIFGSFSFDRRTNETDVGPFQFSMKKRETVTIPAWVGVSLIAVGGMLLTVRDPRHI